MSVTSFGKIRGNTKTRIFLIGDIVYYYFFLNLLIQMPIQKWSYAYLI